MSVSSVFGIRENMFQDDPEASHGELCRVPVPANFVLNYYFYLHECAIRLKFKQVFIILDIFKTYVFSKVIFPNFHRIMVISSTKVPIFCHL